MILKGKNFANNIEEIKKVFFFENNFFRTIFFKILKFSSKKIEKNKKKFDNALLEADQKIEGKNKFLLTIFENRVKNLFEKGEIIFSIIFVIDSKFSSRKDRKTNILIDIFSNSNAIVKYKIILIHPILV